MKKKILYGIFLVAVFLSFTSKINAVEFDPSDTTCNYTTKAHLNKIASSIKVSYEFKNEANGKTSFNISVYNITDDIHIDYRNDFDSLSDSKIINYSDTKNGTYTFNVKDTENIIKYTFVVKTDKYGCSYDLRNLYLIKPKRNKLHDEDVCKFQEVQDFIYCQEWINQKYNLSDEDMIKRIKEQRKNVKATEKTICVSCQIEEENRRRVAEFNQLKRYIMYGLIAGIIIDILVIIILIVRIRKADVW